MKFGRYATKSPSCDRKYAGCAGIADPDVNSMARRAGNEGGIARLRRVMVKPVQDAEAPVMKQARPRDGMEPDADPATVIVPRRPVVTERGVAPVPDHVTEPAPDVLPVTAIADRMAEAVRRLKVAVGLMAVAVRRPKVVPASGRAAPKGISLPTQNVLRNENPILRRLDSSSTAK